MKISMTNDTFAFCKCVICFFINTQRIRGPPIRNLSFLKPNFKLEEIQ